MYHNYRLGLIICSGIDKKWSKTILFCNVYTATVAKVFLCGSTITMKNKIPKCVVEENLFFPHFNS